MSNKDLNWKEFNTASGNKILLHNCSVLVVEELKEDEKVSTKLYLTSGESIIIEGSVDGFMEEYTEYSI